MDLSPLIAARGLNDRIHDVDGHAISTIAAPGVRWSMAMPIQKSCQRRMLRYSWEHLRVTTEMKEACAQDHAHVPRSRKCVSFSSGTEATMTLPACKGFYRPRLIVNFRQLSMGMRIFFLAGRVWRLWLDTLLHIGRILKRSCAAPSAAV